MEGGEGRGGEGRGGEGRGGEGDMKGADALCGWALADLVQVLPNL